MSKAKKKKQAKGNSGFELPRVSEKKEPGLIPISSHVIAAGYSVAMIAIWLFISGVKTPSTYGPTTRPANR